MGCSSLKKAPKLPATTLAQQCYSFMFYGCASLRTAPMLLSTNPSNAYSPYERMFTLSGVIYVPYVAMSFDFTHNSNAATIIHKRGTTVTWASSSGTSKFYVYNDVAPDSMTSLWDDDPDVFMANVIAYYALNS